MSCMPCVCVLCCVVNSETEWFGIRHMRRAHRTVESNGISPILPKRPKQNASTNESKQNMIACLLVGCLWDCRMDSVAFPCQWDASVHAANYTCNAKSRLYFPSKWYFHWFVCCTTTADYIKSVHIYILFCVFFHSFFLFWFDASLLHGAVL